MRPATRIDFANIKQNCDIQGAHLPFIKGLGGIIDIRRAQAGKTGQRALFCCTTMSLLMPSTHGICALLQRTALCNAYGAARALRLSLPFFKGVT